jgi:hypothetical protein
MALAARASEAAALKASMGGIDPDEYDGEPSVELVRSPFVPLRLLSISYLGFSSSLLSSPSEN